jgi:tetratricopeptide (TPR) repeat protein
MSQGRLRQALRHFEIARTERTEDIYLIRNIAEILLRMNRNQEAIQAFRRLIELGDDLEEATEGIVFALRQEGQFEEAEQVLDDLLRSMPNSVVARCMKASGGTGRLSDRDIGVLEKSADDPELVDTLRASVSFALGKAHADLHEHDRAFAHYRTANAIIDETMAYDPDADDSAVAGLTSMFSPAFFDRFAGLGSPSERPVFVFGMPRSGTTLVEQIIASHPDAKGGGELVDMLELPYDLEERLGTDVPYPGCLSQLTDEAVAGAAERYLTTLDSISRDADRITDKMPANYERLGLIAILFPRAKLVHCRRDPRATCLSIFFQNFAATHEYAYDLYKIGRRYRRYLHLMELWRRVLPIPILEIDYEDVIADLEGNCRRLLTFCDLPWNEQVLRFYDTSRSVQTVSLWQVRQPLYRSSIDVWRHYEKFLEPLERGLKGEPA